MDLYVAKTKKPKAMLLELQQQLLELDVNGEVRTELDTVKHYPIDIFLIRAWVPLLGALTIYQHYSVHDDNGDLEYMYYYRIGSNDPNSRVFMSAVKEIQRRLETVLRAQRRDALCGIVTALRLTAALKEAS